MGDPVFRLVTGNRLRDGKVIYFVGAGVWTPLIAEARLVEEWDGAALLAEAQAGPPPHPAIAPTLIEATRDGERVVPVTLRDRIRAGGPTIAYAGG
ncbi:MAG: DUF2849 domain-containing protein [Alphaproteobacteria bacterium]|nr:DUF2849 domain-containing protein [Alphaproteobacteria bacterium]